MNLKEYVEKETKQKITISEEDLKEIINSENDTVCDYNSVREELSEDWRINSYIEDYVNFGELAENDGFERINNDTFIRKWSFEEFCEEVKNKDINRMVIQ